MRSNEADRRSTVRVITAAFKDKDIAARGSGDDEAGVSYDDLQRALQSGRSLT
jgi:uncharacterized protein YqeY